MRPRRTLQTQVSPRRTNKKTQTHLGCFCRPDWSTTTLQGYFLPMSVQHHFASCFSNLATHQAVLPALSDFAHLVAFFPQPILFSVLHASAFASNGSIKHAWCCNTHVLKKGICLSHKAKYISQQYIYLFSNGSLCFWVNV